MHRSSVGTIGRNTAFACYNNRHVVGTDVNQAPMTATASNVIDESNERIVRNSTESLSTVDAQFMLNLQQDPSKDQICNTGSTSNSTVITRQQQLQATYDDTTETEDVTETTTSAARECATYDVVTESIQNSNYYDSNNLYHNDHSNHGANIISCTDEGYEDEFHISFNPQRIIPTNANTTSIQTTIIASEPSTIEHVTEQLQEFTLFTNDNEREDHKCNPKTDGHYYSSESNRYSNSIESTSYRSLPALDNKGNEDATTGAEFPNTLSNPFLDHHHISLPELIERIERACSNTTRQSPPPAMTTADTPLFTSSRNPPHTSSATSSRCKDEKLFSLDHTYHNDLNNRHYDNVHYENDVNNSGSSCSWTEEECGTATSSELKMFQQQQEQQFHNNENSYHQQEAKLCIDSNSNENADYSDDDDSGCTIQLPICTSCHSSVTWYEGSDIEEIAIGSSSMDYDDDNSISDYSDQHELIEELLSTFS